MTATSLNQWKLDRRQPWGKEVYWRVLHEPSGLYAPVSTFTFGKKRDAKKLVDALNECPVKFQTFPELESRPADRSAIVSILSQFTP